MGKWVVYMTFMVIYMLITFFGLGPVLLADGSAQERLFTFLIVVILYLLTTYGLWWFVRRKA